MENGWYKTFTLRFNELAESLNLNEDQTNRLRDFFMTTARDQFKAGNRSGASWAFQQAREKIEQGLPI